MQEAKRIRCESGPVRTALLCPLCDDLLREATTATECCHTFCRACLDQHITVGGRNNTCPECGAATILGPDPYVQRKLEYDAILDDIVRNIFPREGDAERMKQRQDREAEIREARAAMGLPSRVSTSSMRRPLNFEESNNAPQLGSSGRSSQRRKAQPSRKAGSGAEPGSQVDITQLVLIIPLSGEGGELLAPRLERPYLNISKFMGVESLRKYVAAEVGQQAEQIELQCCGTQLDVKKTVGDITQSVWMAAEHKGPMPVVQYRSLS